MSEGIGSVDRLSVATRTPGVAGDGAAAAAAAAVTNLRCVTVITITKYVYLSSLLPIPAVS